MTDVRVTEAGEVDDMLSNLTTGTIPTKLGKNKSNQPTSDADQKE
jgi:hypothetical protein